MQQALFDTMARQVADRCQAHLNAARAEADGILAEARARAERRFDEAVSSAKDDVRRAADRARQLIAIESEHESLMIEQSISDEILQMAGAELTNVAKSPQFPAIFDALLAEVMTVAPKDAVVLVPPAFVDRARGWLQQHGHTSVTVQESGALRDGCAMQDAARTYRVTNTLASRLNKLQNEARKACLDALFGGGAA